METEDVWRAQHVFVICKFCGMNLWKYKHHQPVELQRLSLCSLQAESYNQGISGLNH